MQPWNYKQLQTAAAVERIEVESTSTMPHTMIWAWIDERKGLIRARTFAADWEIPEAQGNDSGSMVLAVQLARKLEVHHGKGSVIFALPTPDDCADIGGHVMEDESLSLGLS
jgi:hypothetical protein